MGNFLSLSLEFFYYFTLADYIKQIVFHRGLKKNKYPLVSRTISNLVDLSSAVVWMVSFLPLMFRSLRVFFQNFWGLFQLSLSCSPAVELFALFHFSLSGLLVLQNSPYNKFFCLC